jgi:hypothetical protein
MAATAHAQQRPAALAPILVEPYDGKEVVDDQIVWTWFMQSKAANGQDVFCDLAVVEVLDGQSAEEAMRLNPPVILRENLTTSTWQTSPAVRGLQHGRRYAWQITAKVPNERTGAFTIVSQSELWELSYHDPTVALEETSGDSSAIAASPATLSDSVWGILKPPPIPTDTSSAAVTVASDIQPDSVVQSVPKPLEISMKARHTFASENRRGNLSTAPVRFDRLQLDPTITLFGVPLNLSLLLTTEQNLRQSDISRGAFGTQNIRRGVGIAVQQRIEDEISELEQQRDSASVDSLRAFVSGDSAAIAERIAQLETLAETGDEADVETLQALNLLTPEQQTMMLFPSFGFGKVAPNFGSLLLDRVTINGGAVEYNPGNLYVAGAVGKTQRQIDPGVVPLDDAEIATLFAGDAGLSSVEFFRNIYSARIGYGRRHASYIALTGMYADDDDQSLSLQSLLNRPVPRVVERLDSAGAVVGIDTVLEAHRVVGRQRNYGFGGVGRLLREDIGLTLDGEFNLSYFDDDASRSAQVLVPLPQALPSFLTMDSALTDYNFALRADWNLPGEESGTLNAGIRYVGGGFRSVGLAGLRTDLLRADARYRTLMFDRQVRIGLNYSFEEAGYKDTSNTSRIAAIGATADLRFHGLPTLSLSYQRHGQNLETAKSDALLHRTTDNTIEQISAMIAWLRQWDDMRWAVFASGMIRNGNSTGGDPTLGSDTAGVFRIRTLQLDNRLSFGPALTVGVLGSYTGTSNHPLVVAGDSTATDIDSAETVSQEIDVYNLDVSFLLHPFAFWEVTLGAVATYQGAIPQPAILGGYVSSRLQLGDIGTIELRFDYRESAGSGLETPFPVERMGRVITSVRM